MFWGVFGAFTADLLCQAPNRCPAFLNRERWGILSCDGSNKTCASPLNE
jgi:hypothetical protein